MCSSCELFKFAVLNMIRMHLPGVIKYIVVFVVSVIAADCAAAQDPYHDYIAEYSGMAVEQQALHGIPASVTLAQGLLESAAGRSSLAVRGNNHFGIKCHSEWRGDTLLRNDDAANECFRSYATAAESFDDHSRFLLRKRYAPLFELSVTDYAGWANGLRRCGYATDPNYASRLIAIIERYALYLFDTDGGRGAEENARFIREMLANSHPVRRTRGLHYVIAAPGDTYTEIAREFDIPVKTLRKYNDATRNRIKDWEEVYLEEKHDNAPDGPDSATIGDGESIHSLAQRFGMKLATLRRLNPDVPDRPGSRLRLR